MSVLCVLYILSYVDRSILAVTATAVSTSLNLSLTEMSLVLGAGFAFVYAGIGIPVAHWMDNGDRRLGLLAGVVVWSLSTGAASFAEGFWSLLICRAGVAVGEAVLTPAAVSMIADLFPSNRRSAPMTAYSAVGALMGMGSFIGGAAVLRVGDYLTRSIQWESWRITLLLLSAPGFLLAVLIAITVREPRRAASGLQEHNSGTLREFVRYLLSNRKFYLFFYLGSGLGTLFPLALMAWSPTLLVRQHGVDQALAAYQIGWVGVGLSIAGTLLWPTLAKLLEARAPGRGAIGALACAAVVALLPIFSPASSNTTWVIVGVGVAMACLGAWSVLPALIIQQFAPGRMRARMIALHLLCISVVGASFGPLAAVRLAKLWGGGENLGLGLFTLGLIAGPLASICYFLSVRAVRVLSTNENTGNGLPHSAKGIAAQRLSP